MRPAEASVTSCKTLGGFSAVRGRSLLDRHEAYGEWRKDLVEAGVWPFWRTLENDVSPRGAVSSSPTGTRTEGVCLSTQDYLGLSREPSVRGAVAEALSTYGPHSGSSPALTGLTPLSGRLCEHVASLTGKSHVVLFPTGWAAGYGAITGLVRGHDHVVIDVLAHNCLSTAARAATSNVRLARHLDNDSVRARLKAIRAVDEENAILVVTEGVFSMDSDSPDLRGLRAICDTYDAALLVDVAHDLGAMGPGGTGKLGEQDMFGSADIVMGSFSKCFATNGGFVAMSSEVAATYLATYAGPHLFSSALSPLQTAAALRCAEIIQSPEGERRRALLREKSVLTRTALRANVLSVRGEVSAIVPVESGTPAVSRLAWRLAEERGVIISPVEYPAVPRNQARYRLQLMADHADADLLRAAAVIADSLAQAREMLGITMPEVPRQGR
ncbi:aminotransferase class I/II-fold pyridoxal phosphate-dependent enzyme [Lentzea sp. JNUCC 0626]|uniref:aminotransferase class I/II-fold pyridoxal phosphate-dependent enzyme n=1 Tax=Lentzea sp. JNUCC 0626 TaxID=3367513 RepID=UPI003748528E